MDLYIGLKLQTVLSKRPLKLSVNVKIIIIYFYFIVSIPSTDKKRSIGLYFQSANQAYIMIGTPTDSSTFEFKRKIFKGLNLLLWFYAAFIGNLNKNGPG